MGVVPSHNLSDEINSPALLTDRQECLNVGIGLLFLILIVSEIASGHAIISTKIPTYKLLTEVAFFNATHVFLTFFMLMIIPDFRLWINLKTNHSPARFWLKTLILWVTVFLLLSFVGFGSPHLANSFAGLLDVLILGIIPLHHSLAQMRGISLLYNRNMESTTGSPFSARREQLERICFTSIIFAFSVYFGIHFAYFQKWAMFLTPYRLEILYLAAFFATATATALLVVNSFFSQQRNKSLKPLYTLRLLFFPLAFAPETAIFAIIAIHGIEYVFVTEKILTQAQSPEGKKSPKRLFLWLTGLVAILIATLCLNSYSGFYSHPMAIFLLTALRTTTFIHYHLDHCLFAMRDPTTRKIIGRLLIKKVKVNGLFGQPQLSAKSPLTHNPSFKKPLNTPPQPNDLQKGMGF